MAKSRFIRTTVLIGVAALLAVFATAEPASAKRKRYPAANEICFDPALSKADQSDCKKQMSDQTTADGRSKVSATFKRKVAQAKAAPVPPASPAK